MLRNRIIPCLLIKDGDLVKTRHFSSPVYIGDPLNAIRIFNQKEVDELMVLDIGATKSGSGPNFALIEKFASECFMPLCYGGGIKTFQQAQAIFKLGVEKICLQSSVLEDPSLITEVAKQFGSQSVVVSADVKSNWLGRKKLFSHSKNATLPLSIHDFLKRSVDAGAGEILLNSVDRDGTMQGMDVGLIKEFSEVFKTPLIAIGGVGNLKDIKQAIKSGASAVAAGAFFVFHGPHRAVLITYPKYQELESLLGESI